MKWSFQESQDFKICLSRGKGKGVVGLPGWVYIYMNEDLQDLQPELVSLQCQTYKGKRIKEVKGNKPWNVKLYFEGPWMPSESLELTW